jgi:hypothetical protein
MRNDSFIACDAFLHAQRNAAAKNETTDKKAGTASREPMFHTHYARDQPCRKMPKNQGGVHQAPTTRDFA